MFSCMHCSDRVTKGLFSLLLLFSGVKTLGTADDKDDYSAASWVAKMKKLEEEKRKAEKKVNCLILTCTCTLYTLVIYRLYTL